MSSVVFSHMMGTLALLGVMFFLILTFSIVYFVTQMNIQDLRLAEVAESVAREIVEIASVHTLGGGRLTYMYLTIPQEIYGQGYQVELLNAGSGRLIVRVKLQTYEEVRVVVVPNFGESNVKALESEITVGDITVSPMLRLPAPLRDVGGVMIRGKPAVVAVTQGDTIYLGFTIIWG